MRFTVWMLPLILFTRQEPTSNAAAAVSSAPSAICVVNADGSGRIQVTDGRRGDEEPKWSPDA